MRLLHNLIPALPDTECILINVQNLIVCQTATAAEGSPKCSKGVFRLKSRIIPRHPALKRANQA